MRFRLWVVAATVFFILGLAGGIIAAAAVPELSEVLQREARSLGKLGSSLAPFRLTTLFFIYFKNTLALGLSFLFSPLLCLAPVLALFFNGALLAYVGGVVIQEGSVATLLAGLLPHGIIEIPAFIIGEAAALAFGSAVIGAIISADREKAFLPRFKVSWKYLLISIVMLIPAAMIETFITPLLLR